MDVEELTDPPKRLCRRCDKCSSIIGYNGDSLEVHICPTSSALVPPLSSLGAEEAEKLEAEIWKNRLLKSRLRVAYKIALDLMIKSPFTDPAFKRRAIEISEIREAYRQTAAAAHFVRTKRIDEQLKNKWRLRPARFAVPEAAAHAAPKPEKKDEVTELVSALTSLSTDGENYSTVERSLVAVKNVFALALSNSDSCDASVPATVKDESADETPTSNRKRSRLPS